MLKKDYKLFFTLILWSLVPSIYTLIRMNIVAVSNVDINILGQMEWFDLINEVVVTALTVPLYYLLKPNYSDKHKSGSAFLVSFAIYTVFTIVIAFNVGSIARFMDAEYASHYLFMQSISMLIGFVSSFALILFTLNDSNKTINRLLLLKIACLIIFDVLLIPRFSDIGSSCSEILTNVIISVMSVLLLCKRGLLSFRQMTFKWMTSWVKIGSFSGVQIFLDNFIYAVMVCKMVNAVSEAGNYWVANNFIWGWLLVPVLCISEIIKKNNLEKLTFNNVWKFAFAIAGVWMVSLPFWEVFLTDVMAINAEYILKILYPLVVFYLAYIPASIIDSWFVSRGKIVYNTVNSLVVNIVYYGILFVLFKNGVFEPNIQFIVNMFGWGMVVHLLISIGLYVFERKTG